MGYGGSHQFACFTNCFATFAYYQSVHFLGHFDLRRSELSSPLNLHYVFLYVQIFVWGKLGHNRVILEQIVFFFYPAPVIQLQLASVQQCLLSIQFIC